MNECTQCWHWTVPLTLKPRRITGGGMVAMRYEEWLMYHLHVVVHQGGIHSTPNDALTAA